jgi:hypothetical protein
MLADDGRNASFLQKRAHSRQECFRMPGRLRGRDSSSVRRVDIECGSSCVAQVPSGTHTHRTRYYVARRRHSAREGLPISDLSRLQNTLASPRFTTP